MQSDLADAYAAVDWAVSQIKILDQRINQWIKSRPYIAVTEPDGDTTYDIIKARFQGNPLPLVVNAEAGAIINMIRSSLDILAVTLAERNGHIAPKDVYFPIATCVLDFIDPVHGAIKKIARLSDIDRRAIEKLKPYQGGDNVLFSLHQLDLIRKHRKLIGTAMRPRTSVGWWGGQATEPKMLMGGELKDGAPLWRVTRNSSAKAQLSVFVCFTETSYAIGHQVTWALQEFTRRATEIIKLFDDP